MPAAHELCENPFAKFWTHQGILFFKYKQGVFINLEVAQLIVADRLYFQNERAYPILCDIRGVTGIDKAGRDYSANYGSTLTKAVALLCDELVLNTIGLFYLNVNKPSSPTQVFMDETAALHYLKGYI